MGYGPMQGRGAGYCAGYPVPGYVNTAIPCGRLHGWRHWYHATGLTGWERYGYQTGGAHPVYPGALIEVPGELPAFADEVKLLKKQARLLEKQLSGIKKRLAQLGGAETVDERKEG
jgi:hypothetical protein